MYIDSQRSLRPSLSESARCGSVPSSCSAWFVSPSLSGSPFGPCSGSGHESVSFSIFASSVSSTCDGSCIRSSDSPLSSGFNPWSTSQPSLIPSKSVSASSGSVPYCVDSSKSDNPSPSVSVAALIEVPEPIKSSSAALSNPPIDSLVWNTPEKPTKREPKINVEMIAA